MQDSRLSSVQGGQSFDNRVVTLAAGIQSRRLANQKINLWDNFVIFQVKCLAQISIDNKMALAHSRHRLGGFV